MVFQKRTDRWPSAWQLVLQTGPEYATEMVIEIRNISATGCRYAAPNALPAGTHVRLLFGQNGVTGHVVRSTLHAGAIVFDETLTPHQIANLRQFRRLNRTPPSDLALQDAIASILKGA